MVRKSSKQARENMKLPISGPARRAVARESMAVLLFAAAMFLFLCLVSYDFRDPSFNVVTTRPYVSNLCGLIGSHIADALVQALGISSLMLPLGLLILSLKLVMPGRLPLKGTEVGCIIVLIGVVSVLVERFMATPFLKFAGLHAGGALGSSLHSLLLRFLGSGGETLFSLTVITLCILHMSKVSVRSTIRFLALVGAILTAGLVAGWEKLKTAYQAHRETPMTQERDDYLGPYIDAGPSDPDFNEMGNWRNEPFEDDEIVRVATTDPPWVMIPSSEERLSPGLYDVDWPWPTGTEIYDEEHAVGSANPPARSLSQSEAPEKRRSIRPENPDEVSPIVFEEAIEQYLKEKPLVSNADSTESSSVPEKSKGKQGKPITVTRRADENISHPKTREKRSSASDDYLFPPVDLLDSPPSSSRHVDEKLLERDAAILEQKLGELGVRGEVVAIHPGPVITMYELTLAPGVPLRKVINTSDDLAMALKSGSTRVVAPIHGKDTVGIEVPNLNREIVYFREIIESPIFGELDDALKIAMGKGIDGQPFSTSLTRMPHLLIAGATGTGKSVGLNCVICSWLMSCHPNDLKLLLVDPKKLELSYYQDIPHLLHPVVTEPEKVPKVLGWAIREMERRYDLLSQAGAKNVESYNQKVLSGEPLGNLEGQPPEKLPYIVIIVDELAELMMVAAKDIEISIARLAQMARASGIHLILATQRPSVDVITGVIKANFPARMSYQVSAKPDSRTILDTTGAEHLLGMGDMLFLPPGVSKLIRLHGAYVSENEIKRIVDFIKAQRAPVYLQEIAEHVSEDGSTASSSDLIDDPKYDEAVELVTRLGHASISLIQRHMRIGYNRAARIIEAMESEGLIGPSDGTSRPREVLAGALGGGFDRRREAYLRE
ncbi:MAG TPA: DNA translocase FtsK 4TM domain-containing protein [Desulfomonilaceae bacterium]|nr:DNA translocase FtsK 4TM domain-containing protein [Desulfomonilaceae bacterium]